MRAFFKPLVLMGGLTLMAPVHAQELPYSDRELSPAHLAADKQAAGEGDAYDASGAPRGVRIEGHFNARRGDVRADTQALSARGFIDTRNWGALSVEGAWARQTYEPAGAAAYVVDGRLWRLDQRRMPLANGWLADHSLGMTTTFQPSLASSPGRLILPSMPIEGFAGRWGREGLTANASVGRIGQLFGIDAATFNSTGAQLASAGGELELPVPAGADARLRAAAQWSVMNRLPMELGQDPSLGPSFSSGIAGPQSIQFAGTHNQQTLWSALAWEGRAPWADRIEAGNGARWERRGGMRAQFNLIGSQDSVKGQGLGWWLDTWWRTANAQNAAGLFRFSPALGWGPQSVSIDLQGAYWRSETASRQWNAGWSGEVSQSVSGRTPLSAYASFFGRWRPDTRQSVGATLTIRTGHWSGESVQVVWARNGAWAQTQWLGEVARLQGGYAHRVQFSQQWKTGELGPTVATSLGYEQRRQSAVDPQTQQTIGVLDSAGLTWGLLYGYTWQDRLRLEANANGLFGNDGQRSTQTNVSISWPLARHWSMAFRYQDSRGRDSNAPLVVSALTAATSSVPYSFQGRNVMLTVRYEQSAGTAFQVVGGLSGQGSGRLEGVVFFDQDRDGFRSAAEKGAAGVDVVLDGRFVTRTDAQGRFDFGYVAAGEHRVEVQTDRVPLPWSAAGAARTVRVQARDDVRLDMALQREP